MKFIYTSRSLSSRQCFQTNSFQNRWLGLLFAGVWLGTSSPAIATDIYVDSRHDLEKFGQDGTKEFPYKQITSALESVNPEEDTVVHIVGGPDRRYGLLGSEAFPLRLNVGKNSLKIIGTSPEPAIVIGDSRAPAVFEVRADESVGGDGGSVVIQNLRIVQADTGVAAVGPRAGKLNVTLRECVFEFQSDHYAQFVAGEQGELQVAVEDCTFVGSALFGLDLGGQPRSTLEFSIEDSHFYGEWSETPDLEMIQRQPRAAVSIFLDADSQVTGVAERNRFQDSGIGMLVTGAESGSQPGRLSVALLSNSLVADRDSMPGVFVHGLQIATVSHHNVAFQLAHNTLVGGSGFGIFFDDLPEDRGPQFVCGQRSFELLGNVVHDFRLGEISAEYEDGVVPDCVSLRGNALNRSAAIGSNGNIRVSEADLQWRDGLFEPVPDSALVDAFGGDFTKDGLDLLGRCRRTDGDGDEEALVDIGALESPGACAYEFLRGDCQHSGIVDVTDAIHGLSYLFIGGVEITCQDACDVDDSGQLDVSDPIYTLSFLFIGGDRPTAPFPEVGRDPTLDELTLCDSD